VGERVNRARPLRPTSITWRSFTLPSSHFGSIFLFVYPPLLCSLDCPLLPSPPLSFPPSIAYALDPPPLHSERLQKREGGKKLSAETPCVAFRWYYSSNLEIHPSASQLARRPRISETCPKNRTINRGLTGGQGRTCPRSGSTSSDFAFLRLAPPPTQRINLYRKAALLRYSRNCRGNDVS